MNTKSYDYIILGAGIAGSSIAYELIKCNKKILLIDKNDDISNGATGAAGGLLSPLLGKPNAFKELVNNALLYSTDFYKKNTPKHIDNCGTIRIPNTDEDEAKFQSYKPYIDFEYTQYENGYYFPIGSVVDGYKVCKVLTKDIDKLLNYEVTEILYDGNDWYLNGTIKTKNLILTTGYDLKLIQEEYLNIRPVWGQRISIKTSTRLNVNYHKNCSISKTKKIDENSYICSIGATHHRNIYNKTTNNHDTQILLNNANEIKTLDNIEVLKLYGGARASSIDYFPILGSLVNSDITLKNFPHLRHGTYVKPQRFTHYKNLFIINGLGGRGFVLAPYLAKKLIDYITFKTQIDYTITTERLFLRWAKKQKLK